MNVGRLAGPGARQAGLSRGIELIEALQDSSDPLADLRDAEVLGALGVPAASPFRAGRGGRDRLVEELLPLLEALPTLETGASRPGHDAVVAVVGAADVAATFDGLAEVLRLPEEATTPERAAALESADLVIVGPQVAGRPAVEQLLAEAAAAGVPRALVDLHSHVTPQSPELPRALRRLADRCDHLFVVSESAAEQLAGTTRTPVTRIPLPISPLDRSPLGSATSPGALVAFSDPLTGELDSAVAADRDMLLDGVLASGAPLLIQQLAARHGSGHGSAPAADAVLPVRHRPHLAPSLTGLPAAGLDRLADVGVSVEPVTDSQSLFSPRTLQLMASGSLVLSTYNQGVNSHLPQVHLGNSVEDVAAGLEQLTVEDLSRASADGVRRAFIEHHAADVLGLILHRLGLGEEPAAERVLAVAEDADETLHEELAAQTHGEVTVVGWDELPARLADHDVILPVSARRHYAPTYVDEHLAALRHQSASTTTKASGPGQAHQHRAGVDALDLTAWLRPPQTAANPEGLLALAAERRVHVGDAESVRDRGTSSPRRGARRLRGGDDVDALRREVAETAARHQLRLTVIVPVYDNGEHLRHKAFASLRRSSVFSRMHVLLVSDGSTDPVTLDTVEELAADYENVTAFHHAAGGSGSASRPRNTGLELTATEFVTYLDPDNEAVEDGYARLLSDLEGHDDVDFVLGTMTQWARSRTVLPYVRVMEQIFAGHRRADGTIEMPERSLEMLDFRPMGIQTLVARTAWLQSLGISQPVGAVGQDSYFFQQMIHYARRIRIMDVAAHTYYTAVSNSTVNTLNPGYFAKYLPLDRARADWLREVGLLEAYKARRLESFLVSWHLPKLRRVADEEWLQAAENLAELLACYGEHRWRQRRALDFFSDLRAARRRSRRRSRGRRR
ncbi:glycosyltransferase family 2 protein [Nesterenkonia halobia]|uniref:Glycosyltransferase 2-like domain-containing protein n=1 Tax=Nesterenkonia halobia TaxID=37922 RepID=A0ABP6REW5_9MICC